MSSIHRRLSSLLWLSVPLLGGILLLVYLGRMGLLSPPVGELTAIRAVWELSVGVLFLGFLLALFDIYRLLSESVGAEALASQRDPGSGIASLFSGKRSSAARRYAELEGARKFISEGFSTPSDWLNTAQRRTRLELGPLGAATRALAGLLLLLAVLGTFAGMREALPGLSEAIRGAGPVPQDGAMTFNATLSSALDRVADAFGANLLALAGSAILGIAAFGVTRTRHSLFETIGSSLDHLVGSIHHDASGQDLHSAISAVENAARSVAGTTGAISDLGRTLSSFQDRLAESLEQLGSNVNRTIQVRLEQQIATALGEVSKKFGEVATAVSATATSYEGMVVAMKSHGDAMEVEATALREASLEATSTLLSVQETASEAETRLGNSLSEAQASASRTIGEHVDRLGQATEERSAAVETELRSLKEATERATAKLDGATRPVTKASNQLETSLLSLSSLQEELGGALQDQLEAIHGLEDATSPVTERLNRAIVALEGAGDSTSNAVRAAAAEINDASQAQSSAVAELRRELRSEFTAAMSRAEELVTRQSAENAEVLHSAKQEVQSATEALKATENRVLASLEKVVSALERGLGSPKTVDLSRQSITALAEASRKHRRFWPFRKRR